MFFKSRSNSWGRKYLYWNSNRRFVDVLWRFYWLSDFFSFYLFYLFILTFIRLDRFRENFHMKRFTQKKFDSQLHYTTFSLHFFAEPMKNCILYHSNKIVLFSKISQMANCLQKNSLSALLRMMVKDEKTFGISTEDEIQWQQQQLQKWLVPKHLVLDPSFRYYSKLQNICSCLIMKQNSISKISARTHSYGKIRNADEKPSPMASLRLHY